MSKDTSGPAFPLNADGTQYEGLTKREWYAGLAMQALITRDKFIVGMNQPTWTEQCKVDAFRMADAMIAEGNKQ